MKHVTLFAAATYAACSAAAICRAGAGDSYQFTVQQSLSGLSGDFSLTAPTAGTLIGNYDAAANPTGTRTKPGLFGSFGETENLPVGVSLGLGLSATPNTQTSGGFRMDFSFAQSSFNLSQMSLNLLAGGDASLDASATLETESFRTRNPSSLYVGGIPVTLPLGSAAFGSLTAVQTGEALGVITPLEPGRFSFVVAPLMTISGSVEFLGQTTEIPPTPLLIPLQGELVIGDVVAHLTSVQPLAFDIDQPIGQALPQFAFDLPTILPPGDVSHLLFDLALESLTASLSGTLTTDAIGTPIPEPTTLTGLIVLATLGFRRR